MPEHRLAVLLSAPLVIVLLAACGSNGDDDPTIASPTLAAAPQSIVPAGVCDRPIPPLTTGPITKERLEAAVQKMGDVQQAADAGDLAAARAAFAGDTHDITHDIDQPLRASDPLLARDLCASIFSLERQFAGAADLQAVATEAIISAALLRDAGRALSVLE